MRLWRLRPLQHLQIRNVPAYAGVFGLATSEGHKNRLHFSGWDDVQIHDAGDISLFPGSRNPTNDMIPLRKGGFSLCRFSVALLVIKL